MRGQEKSLEKKRGRPAIGKGLQFNAMLRPELADKIDSWIARQPEPRPSRPEAIRRLVEQALGSAGAMQSDASLDRQIADREASIAQMPSPKTRSPEAALAVMDKALAKNELVEMKNKRTRRQSAGRKQTKPPG